MRAMVVVLALVPALAACENICPLTAEQTLTVEQSGGEVSFHWTEDTVTTLQVYKRVSEDTAEALWIVDALPGRTIASGLTYGQARSDLEVILYSGEALMPDASYEVHVTMDDGSNSCFSLAEFEVAAP